MSAISRETIEAALNGGGVILEGETDNIAVTTSEIDLTARIHFKNTGEIETVPLRELADLLNQIHDNNQSNLSHQLNDKSGNQ